MADSISEEGLTDEQRASFVAPEINDDDTPSPVAQIIDSILSARGPEHKKTVNVIAVVLADVRSQADLYHDKAATGFNPRARRATLPGGGTHG